MLQQTQVHTVIPYFNRFTERFPTVQQLAAASQDEVLSVWTGLGYYRRAKNLYEAAKQIVSLHNGELPNSLASLTALPGIGRSTAGAILSSGFDQPGVILDGNVKRVLIRFHAVGGDPSRSAVQQKLWGFAKLHTPQDRCSDYAQAIMDLGATCCTKREPSCTECPVHAKCIAYKQNRVADFPERKRRFKPRDETLLLLIIKDAKGRFLLQRQPEQGVWGSLWLPPRVEPKESLPEALNRLDLQGASVGKWAQLPALTHTLSHIRFSVSAQIVHLLTTHTVDKTPKELVWYDAVETPSIGLARLTLSLIDAALSVGE